jgi:ATP-dependent DNA helicase RecG
VGEYIYSFKELFDQLNQLDEHNIIEAKKGSEVGTSILETISSFSNEPELEGGFILVGVEKTDNPIPNKYKIVGVPDPDSYQLELANKCKTEFNHPISPHIWCENIDGYTVIGVKIYEVEPTLKEIYIKKIGPYKGAFRRIGSADHKLTDDDRRLLQDLRIGHKFEETPVTNASFKDLDINAINEYRKLRGEISKNSEELSYSDQELLKSLHCLVEREGVLYPTLAGLILFGSEKIIKQLRPSIKIDYIRVDGTEWVSDLESPYMYSIEFRGPLLLLIPKIIRSVIDDLPKGFTIPTGEIRRKETTLVPIRVIRESVVNAITHRNYNTSMPIQVIRYSNRIEIKNPGHSLIEIKNLGKSGSKTRNEHISFVLHETGYAESKGSGIKVIQGEMKKANLTEPIFESSRERDDFIAVFSFHHLITSDDLQWLSRFKQYNLNDNDAKALIYIRKSGTITNAEYRELTGSDIIKASSGLKKLTESGLFIMHEKGTQTFYTPSRVLTEKEIDYGKLTFQELIPELALMLNEIKPYINEIDEDSTQKKAFETIFKQINDMISKFEQMDLSKIDPTQKEFAQNLKFFAEGINNLHWLKNQITSNLDPKIPNDLQDQIKSLGSRKNPAQVEKCIVKLCSIKPFTAAELAKIFKVKPSYLKTKFITKLLNEGKLKFTIPNKPKHPEQAYTIAEGEINL